MIWGEKSSFCMGQGETMRKRGDLKDQSPRESYKGSLHEGREQTSLRKANLGLDYRWGNRSLVNRRPWYGSRRREKCVCGGGCRVGHVILIWPNTTRSECERKTWRKAVKTQGGRKIINVCFLTRKRTCPVTCAACQGLAFTWSKSQWLNQVRTHS